MSSDQSYSKTWEGVPFDAPNGQPGWESSAWAHPELLRRLEGQRGRLAGLEERLLKLEGELPSGTTAVQEARKVARLEKETEAALRSRLELADRVGELEKELRGHRKRDGQLSAKVQRLEAAGLKPSVAAAHDGPTPELLRALCAAGVTRYQAGELVIELNPAAVPRLWHASEQAARSLYFDNGEQGAPSRTANPLDSSIPDDAPPGALEPAESSSGFGIDHDALAAKLEERARAMGGPAK